MEDPQRRDEPANALPGEFRSREIRLRYVRFLDDFPAFGLSTLWIDIGGVQSRADPKIYVVQTATPGR